METKNVKVLGLDLGTNSIGHAVVVKHYEGENAALPKSIEILDANSRIVPPRSAAKDPLADYLKGQKQQSTASERRGFRMMRRINARFILRRERLFRVLHELKWLPAHMENALDWEKHLGRFKIQNDKSQKSSPTDATVEAPRMNWDGEKFAFPRAFDEMVADFDVPAGTLISHDWLVYFLRNKALSSALTNEELAYVIASFNAKRGYYQRGRNEDDDGTKIVRAIEPKIVEIQEIPKDERGKNGKDTKIILDQKSQLRNKDGNQETLCFFIDKFKDRQFSSLKVGDKIANVVVEESRDEDDDGNEILAGTPKCFVDAWLFKKTRAAGTLENSGKTLGSAIYELLKESVKSGDVRIVGGIFGTVNRSFYVAELRKILEKQAEFHSELRSREALEKVALALYPNNKDHRKQRTGTQKTLIDFIIDDVIFYQRPLKTKKSLIDKCELENRPCAAASNPFAQEFRVLQFLTNLRILDARFRDDCTQMYLPTPAHYQLLFDWLKTKKEVDLTTAAFRNELIKIAKTKIGGNVDFRPENIAATAKVIMTNFDDVKKVKLNATRERFAKHWGNLQKKFGLPKNYDFSAETEYALWHICYSVTDLRELEKALRKFAGTHAEIFAGTPISADDFVEEFKKIEPFEDGYSAFSEKALKKLIPLMLPTQNWENVPESARERIAQFLNFDAGTADEKSREFHESLRDSLKNAMKMPMKKEDFCALNLYLARTLVYGNENAENQVKWRGGNDIREFISNARGNGFRAGSLRNPIVEAIALESLRVVADLVDKFGVPDEIHIELGRELNATAAQREATMKRNKENEKARELAENECRKFIQTYGSREKLAKLVERYLLWQEQDKRDPYVKDRQIGLAEALNGKDFQVDHIIPYSKYNNDSRDNKVLTASAVNLEKRDRTGMQFIEEMAGASVGGNALYDAESYRASVANFFWRNRKKQELLLKKDVPEGFYSAQLNNTRYITKFVATHLSKLVRGNVDDGNAISKNVIIVSGAISSRLKDDWGLGNAATGTWNLLMRERVQGIFGNANRLDDGTFSNGVDDAGKCHVPADATDKTGKGGLKRIDHRHHALDAIVIATCERRHVQAINTESAKDLLKKGEQRREFAPPVDDFAKIVREALENKVVSIKGNNRIFTISGRKRMKNLGLPKTIFFRRRLHEDTAWGISADGNKVLLRKKLEDLGTADKKAATKMLENCNDSVVKMILKNHLANCGNDFSQAFSPAGIEKMNAEIARRGNALTPKGNPHKAIKCIHIVEGIGAGFAMSKLKFKPTKIVYGAKGRNVECLILADGKGGWGRKVITFCEKMETASLEENLLFKIRPDDLIYWPDSENQEKIPTVDSLDLKRVFRVRALDKKEKRTDQIIVNPINCATPLTKSEAKLLIPISAKFYPLQVDRLGNITGIVVPAGKNGVPANGVPANGVPAKNS